MKTRPFFMMIVAMFLFAGFTIFVSAQEKQTGCSDELKIEVKKVDALKSLVIKTEVPTSEIGPKMGELYGKLFAYMGQKQIQPAGPPFAVYYSFDPKGNTVFEAGVPVAVKAVAEGEIVYKEFDATKAVSALYNGPYEKMEPAYASLDKYMKDNNLKDKGIAWEVYLTDPMEEPDPNKYRTIIYFPVE